jgi:hypothetical protein
MQCGLLRKSQNEYRLLNLRVPVCKNQTIFGENGEIFYKLGLKDVFFCSESNGANPTSI